MPIAFLADRLEWGDTLVFVSSAIAIIPLSIWLSTATEKIAVVTGSSIGGLVNAVFCNATALIIALTALRKGLVDIVEASITGSIVSALLLLLGLAMLAGGLRYKEQEFKPIIAQVNGSSMTLAVVSLAMPTAVIATSNLVNEAAIQDISVIVSTILIVVYGLTLIFSLGTHSYLYDVGLADEEPSAKERLHLAESQAALQNSEVESQDELGQHLERSPGLWVWIGVLLISTIAIAFLSELFVGVIEPETEKLGLTPLFTGVIFLPLLSDVSGYVTVIRLALKNKMDLTVSTVTGDSLLVALFMAPVLVLVGQVIGQPMTLNFNPFEVVAIAISVTVANLISFRGRSNWLDGSLLLAVYLVLGVAFYYHPA
ncbi:MAG: calcium/proton exchanger [Oscillatoriophycideae cyanobacterium NC_groundwater_1537_Pr4_S-0.65um_50_18]|nr:calcium/proton exchanger [Oscillatoriophycideae cyanobacterium NC_groundwater_1537_Pr4_S-0.65um_50_18]